MSLVILQIFLLIVIAYILGCVAGCLLHQFFADEAPTDFTVEEEDALMSATEPQQTIASLIPASPAPVFKTEPPKVVVPLSRESALPEIDIPRAAQLDDLKRIRGVGRQNEIRLNAIGITSFAQIAGWSKARQAEIGERLSFSGRIEREEWVAQAKALAKGKQTDFSKRVASGDVPSSAANDANKSSGKKPRTLKSARNRKADALTSVAGIGKAIEDKLNSIGVFHFSQLASWSQEEAVWIGNEIGFPGRVERENWIKQASNLRATDEKATGKQAVSSNSSDNKTAAKKPAVSKPRSKPAGKSRNTNEKKKTSQ